MTRKVNAGFTIVELLITIVIIGILASIAVVSYRGIQDRATQALLQSDLRQAANNLEIARVDTGQYPADMSELQRSEGVSFDYTSDGGSYCITATHARSSTPYRVDSSGSVTKGACVGHDEDGGSQDPPGDVASLPEVVGVTSGQRNGNGGFSVALPQGAASYIAVAASTNKSALSAPSGWSLIGTQTSSNIYRSTSGSPGTLWNQASGDGPVAVVIIGYDRTVAFNQYTNSNGSTTSPSITAATAGLVMRGATDLNDADGAVGYPGNATIGRVQRVRFNTQYNYAASVAVAHSSLSEPGVTGTASWTIPAPWQPSAFTAIVTEAP